MPGSFPVFDHVLSQLIGWMVPTRALDLGAGAGKLGRLVRQAAPGCERVAVEVHERYVEAFGLRELYQRVDVADATRWWIDNPEEVFDLVVADNLLQNLSKSAGLDLLNAMVYRCGWLVLVLPEFIIQGALDDALTNVHRSVWSERDLHWHDLWAWDNTRAMTLALLRGYQPSPLNADDLVRGVNDGALAVHDYDGEGVVRNCRLRLVDHSREVSYRPR